MYFGQNTDDKIRVHINYSKLLCRMGLDLICMTRAAPKGCDLNYQYRPHKAKMIRIAPHYQFRNDKLTD